MSILITSPCPERSVEKLGIKAWPIWTYEAGSFDWKYVDNEICLLIAGEEKVTPEG